MQLHEERVVAERNELDDKIIKLSIFINSERYRGLPSEEKDRLSRQRDVMREYTKILGKRILNFPK